MITVNKRVAVTPFPTTQTKTDVSKGVAVVRQRAELTKLRVVYDCVNEAGEIVYCKGLILYFYGDACKHQAARSIFEEEEGKPFILLPTDMVVAASADE